MKRPGWNLKKALEDEAMKEFMDALQYEKSRPASTFPRPVAPKCLENVFVGLSDEEPVAPMLQWKNTARRDKKAKRDEKPSEAKQGGIKKTKTKAKKKTAGRNKSKQVSSCSARWHSKYVRRRKADRAFSRKQVEVAAPIQMQVDVAVPIQRHHRLYTHCTRSS